VARFISLIALLLAGCATPPQQQKPQMAAWAPTAQWWQAAAVSGGRLREKDGEIHHITRAQARNLSEALEKLAKESGITSQLAIVKSEQMNAFATIHLGRPMVAFTLPFLRALGEDRDAIASVMGHELAHLKLDHRAARKNRADNAVAASNVVGTVLSVLGVPLGGTVASMGIGVVTATFSRDEEREADELGNTWATAAGFDPCGGVRSMQALQKAARSAQIPFLSTHPGHDERIERANELSLKLKGTAC
jgi:predicted Zn-dependent protease